MVANPKAMVHSITLGDRRRWGQGKEARRASDMNEETGCWTTARRYRNTFAFRFLVLSGLGYKLIHKVATVVYV